MPELSSLNAVDYTILAVLVISGVMATFRGMTREIMGLIGWGLAVVAGRLFKPIITDRIGDAIGNETASEMIGFIAPFLVVVVAWFFFANITAPGLKKITLGKMDRPLGFLFGVIRGVLIVTVAYMAALMLLEDEQRFPESVLSSASIVPARVIGSSLAGFAPEDMRDSIENSIPEQDIGTITDEIINQGETLSENAEEAASEVKETLLPDEQLPIPELTE